MVIPCPSAICEFVEMVHDSLVLESAVSGTYINIVPGN